MVRTSIFLAVVFTLIFPRTSHSLDCVNVKTLFDIKYKLNQPSDLSISPSGDIYVVNGVNNKIMVFNKKGVFKYSFGTQGSGKGQFQYPLGIDIAKNGKIFIADTGNHRIQVFDTKGNYINHFTVKPGANEKKSDPVDVVASQFKDYLFISDNDNHKIKVYSQNGKFIHEWGKFGEEYGDFRYPGILATNEYNELFVVDVLNTRVQKFTPLGKFISDIGSWGVLPGKFFRPKGVVIDRNNRVWVSDSYMGVIQLFTDLGRFIGVVCENNKKRSFNTPVGMVTDKKKRLYVVEMRGNKVTVLKMLE